MPRSSTPSLHGDQSDRGSTSRPKRTSACLHCRRQKLKCDGAPDKTCTRCRDDGVECVVRPRANAAILTDDLRWQQSVETRLQSLAQEIEHVRAANSAITRQINGHQSNIKPQIWPPINSRSRSRSRSPTASLVLSTPRRSGPTHHPQPLPPRLDELRDILRPALAELQQPVPLDVSIEDATLLWEFFYASLAIFHGFTASSELDAPSPLLFSAVVTASAKRYTGPTLSTPVGRWEELFQRALVRLLYITVPKTWDDVVGLGIARTWFWKADEITAGLIYGSYVETRTPNQKDARDRRVWDFLEMTTVSHGILHLSTPIVPDKPPRGVQERQMTSHILHMALNELFDALGLVSRAITNPRSLVMLALTGQPSAKPLTFAEIVVLRSCRADLEQWAPKWLYECQNATKQRLPEGSSPSFIADLVTLYYHVALVVVDGYLNQADQANARQRYETSARDLLALVVGRWAESLQLWPKLFIHTSLIAAIALPAEDPLVRRTYDLFAVRTNILQTSGGKLVNRLGEYIESASNAAEQPSAPVHPLPIIPPTTDLDLPTAMAYSASDSFWADLSGVLGLNQDLALDQGMHGPPPAMHGPPAEMHAHLQVVPPQPQWRNDWGRRE